MIERIEGRQAYIEELSQVLEGFGLSRMAGRVLAALLIADPPEQTAEQLAEQLKASRGSISGAVQLLEHSGLIERTRKLGDRRDYFRNKPNAMYESMKSRMLMFGYFTQLIDKGFQFINQDDPEVSQGLRDFKEAMEFYETELPLFFEHFENALAAKKLREKEAKEKA